MGEERTEASGVVQSVHRALTILELLARSGEVSVSEVAAELGVHRSTASRLVAALVEHEMVQQPEVRGRVRLGPGILRLAGAANARLDLVQEARPVCRALAARTNETVNLAVLADRSALYVDQVIGPSTITSYNWVGQHIPLHATSNGRILVSEMPSSVRLDTWGELSAYTDQTVTDAGVLEQLVAQARTQGYAVVRDELDVGLTAVAAPVRNAHGEISASMSISGPTFRIGPARVDELVPLLVRAAGAVSARLGWLGEAAPGAGPGTAVLRGP
ncbi:IclR family transcriptional regulator [Ornithinimicrobium pratense]|uniref:IclR family transcriptional regulator n=1 Tax=Ornithinimicrobium pratense TaxID=2593973 RepID=A0A5J6V3M4_9MICO|nr:IclR family transcriptional regulator [Ornithinimicrobium pratense]QFG67904.1 IclR family transcriptional regulator [Ornithinimicrobium pratense]